MSRRGRAEECDRPREQNWTRRAGPGQPERVHDGGPQEIEGLASIFLEIEREISLGRGGTWLPTPRAFRGRRRFKIPAALARREEFLSVESSILTGGHAIITFSYSSALRILYESAKCPPREFGSAEKQERDIGADTRIEFRGFRWRYLLADDFSR